VRGWEGKGEGGGKGEEMMQTLYAHMNKRNNKNKVLPRIREVGTLSIAGGNVK
jgi:hypothetical protein